MKEFVKKFESRDPYLVAKDKNIVVKEADLGEVYGYYAKIRRTKFIFLNDKMSYDFKRFTCAHELGHALLHPDECTPKLSKLTIVSNLKIEREANEFATNFLIDDSHVEYNIDNKYKLLDFYGIPHEMDCYI